MDQKTANTNRTHSVRGDTAGTVCNYKRLVFISTLNFPSAENDTNLFIASFTLRDALQFRICIEKYPFIQVKFLCTNLFLCFV